MDQRDDCQPIRFALNLVGQGAQCEAVNQHQSSHRESGRRPQPRAPAPRRSGVGKLSCERQHFDDAASIPQSGNDSPVVPVAARSRFQIARNDEVQRHGSRRCTRPMRRAIRGASRARLRHRTGGRAQLAAADRRRDPLEDFSREEFGRRVTPLERRLIVQVAVVQFRRGVASTRRLARPMSTTIPSASSSAALEFEIDDVGRAVKPLRRAECLCRCPQATGRIPARSR